MQPEPDYGQGHQSWQRPSRGQGGDHHRRGLRHRPRGGACLRPRGADVLISYLPEEPDAQETARAVEVAGKKVVKMPGDIGDEAHCQRLLEQAISEFGKIDILVNNAAYQMYRGG